ncbi:GPI-anchored surface protein, putative [Bodo saltans]|uniref:GPI-anchored surface protein, putative n=1 Tax=Bodo saltans TaxID=75058 RepID=A0A0S4KDX8_BODSA|nr:GPI-anchored surface protein, putative [Bodo saltans]|eukprot:CUI11834.1 GPI-anchored surface protein, putative [Bodo saltans]
MVRAALGSVAWLLVRTTESMPDAVDSWLASIPMLSRWLIPLLLPLALRVGVRYVENHQYMMSATAAPLPNTAVMLETMRYVEDVVAAVRDIPRLYDLIVRNGHKALVLETLQAQAAQEYKGKLDNNVESGLVEEDGVDDVAKSSTNTLARRFQQGDVGGGDMVVIINAIHFHKRVICVP